MMVALIGSSGICAEMRAFKEKRKQTDSRKNHFMAGNPMLNVKSFCTNTKARSGKQPEVGEPASGCTRSEHQTSGYLDLA